MWLLLATQVVLWHSYRGAEEQVLEKLVQEFERQRTDLEVEVVAIPNDSLPSKLNAAIPRGHGPDVFIFFHDRVGDWAESQFLAPIDEVDTSELFPETVEPCRYGGHLYALPLAFKSVALVYNKALVKEPPRSTDELFAVGKRLAAEGRFPLVYESGTPYYHAAWYFGFGAELIRADGSFGFDSPAALASLDFLRDLQDRGVIPQEVSGALVSKLFNEGKAAMAMNGPWFIGEIDRSIDVGVAPLPTVTATGRPASPFLGVEAVFLSSRARQREGGLALARFLVGREAAIARGVTGRQTVANRLAWQDRRLADDPVLAGFRAQMPAATPMDNRPVMRMTWEPTQLALKKVLREGAGSAEAARAAVRRFRSITGPTPPRARTWPYLMLAGALGLAVVVHLARWGIRVRRRGEGAAARRGWLWIGPAMSATAILILFPFVVGLALSLFSHSRGDWTFVGLGNFGDILASSWYGFLEPLSFYYALLVTVAWTAVNLVLHVGVGLALALLLTRQGLRLRPLYRVILILPWAVPNYITALIWRTLFHKQYGAINGLLGALGFDGVSWFSSFPTAFFANVCANAWLGFPFMMVVCMGALQSIPRDLYEAADVDGATGWQKLGRITLPLLKPALIPAVLLGVVWTFNQFNVVYLVSGGEPENATDILISEAYRWAFARQEQYGYGAAYAALIFLILMGWSVLSTRLARRAEEAR
jgi:arabinogalactan oligomer/maltooligosaccharide transport system permease protein